MRRRDLLPLLALPALIPGTARAQSFPARPVRAVVPYAPGGSVDVVARAVGVRFQELTGQPLLLDNRAGAGGVIGADHVAKSAPDGLTLLVANAAQVAIAKALNARLPYEPETDLLPVTHLIDTPMVLFAAQSFRGEGLPAVLAAARERPGAVPFGTPGVASFGHLLLELFQQAAGIAFLHAPYRGAALVLNDMAGGTIPFTFTAVGSAKGLMDAGTVRPIAVASARRTPALPDTPTFIELGLPSVEAPLWFGMMAPKGTPEPIIATLHRLFAESLQAPEARATLGRVGADIVGNGPGPFAQLLREDMARWIEVVRRGNITIT
jgi:tripartite-type tricarboxylate transporter receptor subunit TctC